MNLTEELAHSLRAALRQAGHFMNREDEQHARYLLALYASKYGLEGPEREYWEP